MKRVALCLFLIVIALSSAAQGQGRAFKCILTGNCTPPPCEFFAQLNLSRASVRALANAKAPESSSDAAFNKLAEDVGNEVAKAVNKYSKCKLPDSPARTFITGPNPDCAIGFKNASGSFTPVSLDEALRASQTCSEIVEAHYKRHEVRQAQCGNARTTVAVRRAEMLLRHQAELDSLRSSLLRYLSSCAPNPQMAIELSNMGLQSLMDDGRAAFDKWQAKRASGTFAGAR
jgi:hypothetical protein